MASRRGLREPKAFRRVLFDMERRQIPDPAQKALPRPHVWAAAALLALFPVVVACGEVEKERIAEATLSALKAEIEALERASVPAAGTSRAEVESRFGRGRPVRASKVPVDAPPSSPDRAYELASPTGPNRRPVGTLRVRYDGNWNVRWSRYVHPYTMKRLLPGEVEPLDGRYREARQRLAQLRRIRQAIKQRFGE